MKKRILALFLSLAMVVTFMPAMAFAEIGDSAFAIGDQGYATLQEAIGAVESGQTIVLQKNSTSVGVSVPSGKNFILDFNGKTLTLNKPGAGSTGTTTNGFQLLKDSTIEFKNGTLNVDSKNIESTWNKNDQEKGIALLIQNYANLTLDNMKIDGTNLSKNGNTKVQRYVLSNCYGATVLKKTTITAAENDFAFDVDYQVSSYPDGAQVTVDADCEIDGLIDTNYMEAPSSLTINGGSFTDLATAAKYAEDKATVKLLKDSVGAGIKLDKAKNKKELTIDLNGHKYTANKPVGSSSTENQVAHFDKNYTVNLKNGTLAASELPQTDSYKFLIQNYSNLTVTDVVLDGALLKNNGTVVSNNCGEVKLLGNTSVNVPAAGGVAIDASWWPSYYPEGAQVEVNTTGTINGSIEYGFYGNGTSITLPCLTTLIIKRGVFNGELNTVNGITNYETGLTPEQFNNAIKGKVVIYGGIFAQDVKDYVAAGYECNEGTDHKYSVAPVTGSDMPQAEIVGNDIVVNGNVVELSGTGVDGKTVQADKKTQDTINEILSNTEVLEYADEDSVSAKDAKAALTADVTDETVRDAIETAVEKKEVSEALVLSVAGAQLDNGTIVSMIFDVTPIIYVTVNDVTYSSELSGTLDEYITFRLPLPSDTEAGTVVKVYHEVSAIENSCAMVEGGCAYIEVTSNQFSKYKYELTKEHANAVSYKSVGNGSCIVKVGNKVIPTGGYVEKDTNVTVVATPDYGYQLDTITVDGQAITGNTFKMGDKDVMVSVTFKEKENTDDDCDVDKKIKAAVVVAAVVAAVTTAVIVVKEVFVHSVKVCAVDNGSVSVDKKVALLGQKVHITATPNEGYEVDKVYVNGKEVDSMDVRVLKDTKIKVTFKELPPFDVDEALANLVIRCNTNVVAGGTEVYTTVLEGSLAELKANGYSVTYKFYRNNKAKGTFKYLGSSEDGKFLDNLGEKGKMYYYRAKLVVTDASGEVVSVTALKDCKYGNRKMR
ncbi:MAG: hypothetical protein MJ146_00490 [Clostridia bacterium]|nr:hypothetical protein [Clostridia bacterium]